MKKISFRATMMNCAPIQYRRRETRPFLFFPLENPTTTAARTQSHAWTQSQQLCSVTTLFLLLLHFFPIVSSQQSIGILFRNRFISMADGTVEEGRNRQISWKNAASLDTTTTTIRTHARGRLCAFSIIIKRRRLSHDDCCYLTAKSFVRLPPCTTSSAFGRRRIFSFFSLEIQSFHQLQQKQQKQQPQQQHQRAWLRDSRETPRGEN